MLFNSLSYTIVFLPPTVIVYFLLNKAGQTLAGRIWLVLASLFFYGFTNYAFVPVLTLSIIINYAFGILVAMDRRVPVVKIPLKKIALVIGLVFNLGLLAFYKYANLIIESINDILASNAARLDSLLPLAISFITFQQIAYLVDCYNNEIHDGSFLNYCLFITFFPRLVAGPIVYHNEVMPQFACPENRRLNYDNLAKGLFLIAMGLFKKVVIADSLAPCADQGFDIAARLSFSDAWLTSLSYTLQIYFDFSGYTDMALGSAYLLNIALPVNFNSPYKALNIQDFWRRWHITLSRWLVRYLYIPLGGNRRGRMRTFLNILVTFIICGMWHGAGWTFVAWGGMHGLGIIVYRLWTSVGVRLPKALSWPLTFLYVNCAWVLFRAGNFSDAIKVYRGMVDTASLDVPAALEKMVSWFNSSAVPFTTWFNAAWGDASSFLFVLLAMVLSLAFRNSQELMNRLNAGWALPASIMALAALLLISRESSFIYFRF